jgi:glycosyltransferase involved in cell wall biosynthesis
VNGWLSRRFRRRLAEFLLCRTIPTAPARARLAPWLVPGRLDGCRVSVIIPVNNGMADGQIGRLLDSLQGQTHRNLELIAVDSGSRDGTPEYLRQRGVRVLSIAPEEFRHDRSRNLGAQAAAGDFLLFTVADAVFDDPDWLRLGLAHMNVWRADSFCSPQHCAAAAGLQARALAFRHLAALQRVPGVQRFGAAGRPRLTRIGYAIAPPPLRQRMIHVDDTNHLVRRAAFTRIGFRLPTCEDMGFGHDLIRGGGVFLFSSLTHITHSHRYDDPVRFFRRCAADYQVQFRLIGAPGRADQAWDRRYCALLRLAGALPGPLAAGTAIPLATCFERVERLEGALVAAATAAPAAWMVRLCETLGLPPDVPEAARVSPDLLRRLAGGLIASLRGGLRTLAAMGMTRVDAAEAAAFLRLQALNYVACELAGRLPHAAAQSEPARAFRALAWE